MIAEASGLLTNVTKSRDFRGIDEPLNERGGTVFPHEATLRHLKRLAGEKVLHELFHAFALGRAGQDGVHRDRGPLGQFRKAAGDGELHGLGRA